MKQVFKKFQMWMIALVAMFAFAGTAMAQDAVCTFPNSPWPWNGTLNRVAWTDNGVTFSASAMNCAETGVEVTNTEGGNTLYIDSEETIVKMVFNATSAPIVANVGTIEGNVWTGSATNIEINAANVSTDITYVEVYFEGATPLPAEYKTGESISEGELDKNSNSLVYLFFEGHPMESVDYTQITVGGNAIQSWQLGFWPNSNPEQFSITFGNAMPLAPGDYTIVIPEGAIKFADGNVNAEIELEYYVLRDPVYVNVFDYAYPSAGEVTAADLQNGLYIYTDRVFEYKQNAVTVNGEEVNASFYGADKAISVPSLNAEAGNTYTVVVPAGTILVADNTFNEEIELVYTVPAPAVDPTTVEVLQGLQYVYVTLPQPTEDYNSWGWAWGEWNGEIPAGLEVLDPNGKAVAIKNAYYSYGSTKLCIELIEEPTVAGEYTVNVPAGVVTGLDETLTGTFTVSAPAPKTANYLTGKSVEEGELDAYNDALVYLYFNDHEIESVDATQITVGGQSIETWQLGFWGGDNFYVILANGLPLPAGDYTVVIPEGAVKFVDGKVNEAITLVYTVTAAPAAPETANYLTGKSVEEGELDAQNSSLVYLYFNDHEIESVDANQITVGGQIAPFVGFWGGDNFMVNFTSAMPLVAGDYTIVIPEGAIKFVDGKINEAITLVYTVPSEAVIEGDAVCTFPNDPWPWNGALNRVAWTNNGVTFSAPCMNGAETGVEVSNTVGGFPLYIDSEKTIVKMVFNVTSAPIVANVGTIEGNVWTGSAKSIEIYAEEVSTDITYVEVYFESATPQPAEYKTGESISEGELDKNSNSLVYLFFEGHPMESVDYTQITVGGNAIQSWQLGFWPSSNPEQFYITFGNAIPLAPGDYTIVIPEGAIKFADGNVNAEIELVYYVLRDPVYVNVFDYAYPSAGEIEATLLNQGIYIYTDRVFEYKQNKVTVNGEEVYAYFGQSDKYIYVPLFNAEAGNTYTVVVPAGTMLVADNTFNEEIELVYTVPAPAVDPTVVDVQQGAKYVNVTLPITTTDYNSWGWDWWGEYAGEIPAGLEVLDPNGEAVAIKGASYNYNTTLLQIELEAEPTAAGEYTVNVPAGVVTGLDYALTGTFTVAAPTPEPANYLTGKSVEEGELDANYNSLVYLYFNDHEIESVDATQITVGGQSIETWQLGFWGGDNFYVILANVVPLPAGDYTVVIPEGAVKFVDGKVNETITLVYTVTPAPAEPITVDIECAAPRYIYVNLPITTTDYQSWGTVWGEFVSEIPAGLEVLDPNGNAVEILGAYYNYGTDQLAIELVAEPTVAGEYTVNVPAGVVTGLDEALTGTFTVAAPVGPEYINVIDYTWPEAGEIALDAFAHTGGLYIFTTESFDVVEGASATVNGEEAFTMFYGSDAQIFVSLPNPLEAGQTYTVVIPAGCLKIGNKYNKEITLVYFVPALDIETVTLAGEAALCGNEWDEMDEEGVNALTPNEDATVWTITKENVALEAWNGYAYKVVFNHNWNYTWPGYGFGNAYLYVEESGIYNLTFTYNVADDYVTVTYERQPDPMKGDLNGDELVNVGDYTTEIDIILENIQPTSLQRVQADVNKDGRVNVGDVTSIVNIILERDTQTNEETRAAAAPAFFNLSATLISTENGIRRYALSLDGAAIANFQMDLRLAEGTTLVGKTIGERSNGHYLYGNATADGTERLLAASLMGNNLNGNAGNICYIDVTGEGEIEISDVIVADAAGRTHDVAGLVIGSETGINGISADKAGSTIYSLDGRRTSRMNAGIYVNEGRKTIVK